MVAVLWENTEKASSRRRATLEQTGKTYIITKWPCAQTQQSCASRRFFCMRRRRPILKESDGCFLCAFCKNIHYCPLAMPTDSTHVHPSISWVMHDNPNAWQKAKGIFSFFFFFLDVHFPDCNPVCQRNVEKNMYIKLTRTASPDMLTHFSWIQVDCVVWSTPGAISQTLHQHRGRLCCHPVEHSQISLLVDSEAVESAA